MGALRLVFATAVIFSHAPGLGYGRDYPGVHFSRGQTSLGPMAVCGFFVLSGLLITRSAQRLSVGRFMWHRLVRIMPAFWLCLAATAFVVAPILAHHERMSLTHLFDHPRGPWHYIQANWSLGINEWGISDLLGHNIHPGALDGSLWSLGIEMLCYLTVAGLAAVGVLRRARWVVLVLLGAAYLHLFLLALDYPHLKAPFYAPYQTGWVLPFLGYMSAENVIPLMFIFGLGAAAQLYRDRIPLNAPLALCALVAMAVTMRYGAFVLVGVPAFAYLVIWFALNTPRPLTRIGARADFSYGIYIYGYLAQQCLVAFHWNRWGITTFNAVTVALTVCAAVVSWYLVEKPALRMKNLSYDDLGRFRARLVRRRTAATATTTATATA
ncbi:acyltransferase, partial [Kitasatospora sp. MBT63]